MNIVIPKGCACQNVEIGTYANQVELPTPPHMLAMGGIGCLTFYETICVDRCIADLVQAIWAKGIVTTGCCCGHNIQDGYIGIYEADTALLSHPAAPAQPDAFMWQHDETGRVGFVDAWQVENGWEEINPRLTIIKALYGSPGQPTPAVSAVDINILKSAAQWLDARSEIVWAKKFGHSELMQEYAKELRQIADALSAPAAQQPSETAIWNAAMICDGLAGLYADGNSNWEVGYTMAAERAAAEIRSLLRPATQQPSETVQVTRNDANAYCKILSLLDMEEEGDPVAEVSRLLSQQPSETAVWNAAIHAARHACMTATATCTADYCVNNFAAFNSGRYAAAGAVNYLLRPAAPEAETCKDRCQYSVDVGMWPEHSCGNGCMYEKHAQEAEKPAKGEK